MGFIRLTGIDGSPGPECVAGLNWDTISKTDWKKRKKTAKSDGLAYCEIPVTAGDTNTVNIGILDRISLSDNNDALSLAAWMAHTFKNETVVAVEKVVAARNEEMLWLCVVHNGQVISGTDILADWNEIDAQVSEIIDMLAVTGDVGFIGSEAENLTVNTDTDDDATALVTVLSKKTKGKASVQIPGKVDKKLMGALVAAGVTSVIVIGGYASVTMLTATDDTDRLRQEKIAQEQRAQQAYQVAIQDVKSTEKASAVLHATVGAGHLGTMKTQMGGWSLQGVSCEVDKCEATFANNDLTDPSILSAGLGEHCGEIAVSTTGIEGKCQFTVPEVNVGAGDPLTTIEFERFRSRLMEFGRAFNGASYALEPASEIVVQGKRHLRDKPIPAKGQWALAGSLKHLPQMITLLEPINGTGLASLSMNWQGKTIELSGPYYTQGESQ